MCRLWSQVPSFDAFTKEPKAKRNARRRKSQEEAKEAEVLKLEILEKKKKRRADGGAAGGGRPKAIKGGALAGQVGAWSCAHTGTTTLAP